jgi:hypothetical protein
MILLKIFLVLFGLLVFLLFAILIPKTWLTLRLRLTGDSKTGSAGLQLAGKMIGVLVAIDWPVITVRGGIAGLYFSVWSGQPGKKTARAKTPEAPKSAKSKAPQKEARHSVTEWIEFGKLWLERFARIPRLEKFTADLVVGLGNPASTGMMMGAYYILKSSLSFFRAVHITPDFIGRKINGDLEFSGSIRLIKTIPLIIFTLRYLRKKQNRRKYDGRFN